MRAFEWLVTLIKLLTLKHEKLSIGYTCFDSYYYSCTQKDWVTLVLAIICILIHKLKVVIVYK